MLQGGNIWQRLREQGSAAASSSDPQPLAENQGPVEGTAVASSGGQSSIAVQQWEAQIDSVVCQYLWAAVAGTAEAADVLDTASDLLNKVVANDAGGGSVIGMPERRIVSATQGGC